MSTNSVSAGAKRTESCVGTETRGKRRGTPAVLAHDGRSKRAPAGAPMASNTRYANRKLPRRRYRNPNCLYCLVPSQTYVIFPRSLSPSYFVLSKCMIFVLIHNLSVSSRRSNRVNIQFYTDYYFCILMKLYSRLIVFKM